MIKLIRRLSKASLLDFKACNKVQSGHRFRKEWSQSKDKKKGTYFLLKLWIIQWKCLV